jgi:hypothetical protein
VCRSQSDAGPVLTGNCGDASTPAQTQQPGRVPRLSFNSIDVRYAGYGPTVIVPPALLIAQAPWPGAMVVALA